MGSSATRRLTAIGVLALTLFAPGARAQDATDACDAMARCCRALAERPAMAALRATCAQFQAMAGSTGTARSACSQAVTPFLQVLAAMPDAPPACTSGAPGRSSTTAPPAVTVGPPGAPRPLRPANAPAGAPSAAPPPGSATTGDRTSQGPGSAPRQRDPSPPIVPVAVTPPVGTASADAGAGPGHSYITPQCHDLRNCISGYLIRERGTDGPYYYIVYQNYCADPVQFRFCQSPENGCGLETNLRPGHPVEVYLGRGGENTLVANEPTDPSECLHQPTLRFEFGSVRDRR